MTPVMSRRLAKVVNSPFFIKKGPEFTKAFVDRVSKKDNLNDLSDEDKQYIGFAVASEGESVWQ